MGDYLNLPKSPTQSSSPPPPPPPPPQAPPSTRSNMPMLYYGLVVVATAAIVLAIYNLIIVRWCAIQYRRSRDANHHFGPRRNAATRNNNISLPPSSLSRGGSTVGLTASFRYKKEIEGTNIKTQLDYDTECSVCLSVFEDGEEVRKLPRCNHSFHASCIDMWLYSHSDCPLCRNSVVEPPPPPPHAPSHLPLTPQHRHTDSALSEHSRDGLLDRASSSVSVVGIRGAFSKKILQIL
ncbi:unnamed protein product [Lactuca saligna]|uniref:RING-type E3 ubiquitin transferase n=1 Tax=Lactuca saligna TaxID=75948 RepID=A0AA35ZIB4_LACSI|nr:unnamed protein product [Lactuca saligna]